jgi:hypothetical protein
MFSRAYTDALRDVLSLEAEDVAGLERQLLAEPDNFPARLKLMAYFLRADRVGLKESRERRAQHALWLIGHHPDSEILWSPYASFSPGQLTADEYRRARELWDRALRARESDHRVLWNAAQFFRPLDRVLYQGYLRSAAAAAPENEHYGRDLGLAYAGAIIAARRGPMQWGSGAEPGIPVPYAIEQLDTAENPAILEAAVRLFQSEYNRSLMLGRDDPEIGALAQRYFRRAEALDPGLDRAWVLPQIEPKMIGMLAPGARPPEQDAQRFETAARQVRRLEPHAFSQLPAAVAAVLQRRGCTIPQPDPGARTANVIRGEFFSRARPGWAVLCSTDGHSAILVFRDDADGNPEELARSEDRNYLMDAGEGRVVYSRGIRAVDRTFIIEHYRAYGGPEPPPIDHEGIDDAFLEKASIVHYRFEGKWLQLTGAD